jgi:glycosyltransferase involved in cell wall biosynthesis
MKEQEMAELYNSVDAFVLPTRGEGWGLPAMQAMSMGLPTITTDWGGQMEFLTKENSFRIPVEAVEEIPEDSVYRWKLGKKWARPSLSATRSMMQLCARNPEYAKRVGEVARNHIVRHFSEEAIAAKIHARLNIASALASAKALDRPGN